MLALQGAEDADVTRVEIGCREREESRALSITATASFFESRSKGSIVREYFKHANLRKVIGLRGFAKIAIGKARGDRAA